MGRLHLFEFEDQRWLPNFIRNYMTDFLQFLSNKTKMYKPIMQKLEKVIEEDGSGKIIDIASGGGGGLVWLNEELKKSIPKLEIILTDFYPNISAFENTKKQSDNFDFVSTSIDARDIPKNLSGVRTQFLSLHHFKPIDVKKILQNAIDTENSIAIFEAQERSISSVIAMLFSPITTLLVTPFIKPFRLGRILFTYIIPVLPFLILWDGVVSSLRTYSVEEMEEIVERLNNKEKYNWDIGRIKSGPGVILHLIGTRKK